MILNNIGNKKLNNGLGKIGNSLRKGVPEGVKDMRFWIFFNSRPCKPPILTQSEVFKNSKGKKFRSRDFIDTSFFNQNVVNLF